MIPRVEPEGMLLGKPVPTVPDLALATIPGTNEAESAKSLPTLTLEII
jgi:hypothetical protein